MKLIYRKTLIDSLPERWFDTYLRRDDAPYYARAKVKYDALMALPRPLSAEAVDALVARTGWTDLKCDECLRDDCEVVVELGEEPEHDTRTVWLCLDCTTNALALMTATG